MSNQKYSVNQDLIEKGISLSCVGESVFEFDDFLAEGRKTVVLKLKHYYFSL